VTGWGVTHAELERPADEPVAVVAMTPAGVIGHRGGMPWRLSSDLRRFKRVTMGGALVMGRRTFDSIGRPLPGRRTIVITRHPRWRAEGVEVAGSPEAALRAAAPDRPFVVGGAEIYRELIGRCGAVLLTRVWTAVDGDTRLELDLSSFECLEQIRVPATTRDEVPTETWRLIRRKS